MTSTDFIKENIQRISKSFPETCFRYGFDNLINTHIVEITPNEHFYTLDSLDEAWIPFSIDFMTMFPKEEIVFIASDSPLALSNYSYCCNEQSDSKLISEFFEALLLNRIDTIYSNSILIENEFSDALITSHNNSIANITENQFEANDLKFDEDQFLMAA